MDSVNLYLSQGVRVLRLTGTDLERALQHGNVIGSLNESERRSLAISPLSKKNQSLIQRAIENNLQIPAIAKKPLIRSSIRTYESVVLRHQKHLEDRFKERIEAFAEHSHLPKKDLVLALYQPDMLMVLAALTGEKVSPYFLSGMPGCSSAVVRTGQENGFTLLRNLDYPAAGHWEKWPTVFYHEPAETRFQKFVSVGSLGIHLAGLTGVNESGVAFSLHAHFSKKFSLKGAPIFFLGQEILESAHSIDEAVFLCKSFKTMGSWAINLASDREKRAVTVELSDGKTHVREMSSDDLAHAHSNGFQSSEFKKQELHFSGSFFEDVEARKASLESKLSVSAHSELLSMEQALSSLANHEDFETGEPRIFGNTVSVVTTIQSVAFDLKKQELLLSVRNETPTPLGPFLKLPFHWSKMEVALSYPILVKIPDPLTQEFKQALHDYHKAYCSWHVLSEGPNRTLEHLIRATECLPQDPHLLLQRGYFELLNASKPGHYRQALDCFESALTQKMSTHHQQVGRYFRAVVLDLLQHHDRAMEEYEILSSAADIDPKLRRKSQKRLKNPFKPRYCQMIVPDLQFVEPLEYP